MKSTLLTTTALIAFAGAAAAEVSFSGDVTLGYNSFGTADYDTYTTSSTSDDNDGFFWEADLNVAFSQELDNGLTAAVDFEFDIVDEDTSADIVSDLYVLSLTTDTAGLYYGETEFAAITRWVSAGDMESDGFSEADGETVLRGDFEISMVAASVSYTIADADGVYVDGGGEPNEVDQLSIGLAAEFGQFSVVAAYQEESDTTFGAQAEAANADFVADEIFGLSVGATFAGADITVAYASDETLDENSTGVKVSYPFGDAITATVYYVAEDDAADEDNFGVNVAYSSGAIAVTADYQYDQDVDKWALEGSYDLGNGMTVLAGVLNDNEADEDFYIAGTYDLGGGADLLISYALDDDFSEEDAIGDPEYQTGATVEVNFTF